MAPLFNTTAVCVTTEACAHALDVAQERLDDFQRLSYIFASLFGIVLLLFILSPLIFNLTKERPDFTRDGPSSRENEGIQMRDLGNRHDIPSRSSSLALMTRTTTRRIRWRLASPPCRTQATSVKLTWMARPSTSLDPTKTLPVLKTLASSEVLATSASSPSAASRRPSPRHRLALSCPVAPRAPAMSGGVNAHPSPESGQPCQCSSSNFSISCELEANSNFSAVPRKELAGLGLAIRVRAILSLVTILLLDRY